MIFNSKQALHLRTRQNERKKDEKYLAMWIDTLDDGLNAKLSDYEEKE